jgi:cytochrome c oxidase assembly protein subunit 15
VAVNTAPSEPRSIEARFNWTHLVACLLVAVTAVLLCFGALVTTFDAAMAVPDWPGTYGHNMFLFPAAEWLNGPFDLFLEHGHRLLGATAGLVSLALAAVAFWQERRRLVRWLVVAAVVLVVVQGLLGGARVLLDDRTVAKVHACTGPLFFAVAVAIATVTARRSDCSGFLDGSQPRPIAVVAASLLAAAYVQLVAGAQLRHLDLSVDPASFRWLVAVHLAGAAAVTALAFATAAMAWRQGVPVGSRFWATFVAALVLVQSLLGAGAWVANWGVPALLQGTLVERIAPDGPVVARSLHGSAVVTLHVVTGMAILGGAVVLAIRAGGLSIPLPGRRAAATSRNITEVTNAREAVA